MGVTTTTFSGAALEACTPVHGFPEGARVSKELVRMLQDRKQGREEGKEGRMKELEN